MFSYQQNFFNATKIVSKELFYSLVRAPYTAELIDGIRANKHAAKTLQKKMECENEMSDDDKAFCQECIDSYNKEAAKLKKKLPAFIFQATFDETTSKKGFKGSWRKQAAVKLNGLCVMDIDHVEEPMKIFQSWNLSAGEGSETNNQVLLVYITPSGKGLKVVFKADVKRGNLIDNQRCMAKQLRVEIDESCKDASRMSFICKESDILFINEEIFTYENNEFAEKFNSLYRGGDSKPTVNPSLFDCQSSGLSAVSDSSAVGKSDEVCDRQTESVGTESKLEHPAEYCGVSYKKIVDCWLGGKQPEQGNRHLTSLKLADQLRYICDNNPKLIREIMEQIPFVKAIIDERGENLDQTIASAMGYKLYKSIPKQMRDALAEAGASGYGGDSEGDTKAKNELPLDAWGEEISKTICRFPLHERCMPRTLAKAISCGSFRKCGFPRHAHDTLHLPLLPPTRRRATT